jgi:diguanylate cyclase (GGDEF)-like protein
MPDLSEYSRKWRPTSHSWPVAAAALLGVAVAISAWFAVSIWEQRLARAQFNAVAGNLRRSCRTASMIFLARSSRFGLSMIHAMGDLLLKEVVNRLRNAVRPDDLVARFGGDEFAVLLTEVSDPEATELLRAGRIQPATGARIASSAA